MNCAFFDLDKTLIASNSARLWVMYELRHGFMSRWTAVRALGYLMRYKLGDTDLAGPLRVGIATLEGKEEAALRSRMMAFYHSEVRHLYRRGARDALERHRANGDRLVLLTSTSTYLAHAVCDELGLDDYVSTQLEVDPAGTLTGRAVEPLCFGEGKLARAVDWCAQENYSLTASTFYTDSASDLPVMEVVDTPVAVNPDPRLRRRARRQGWQVVDWGRPC